MQKRLGALTCLALLAAQPLAASDHKDLAAVSTDALSSEGQRVISDPDTMHFVWWIPAEFWQATFAQDSSIPAADAEEILRVLEPYSMLAIVQADISPFGAFRFFPREQVASGLSVMHVAAGGAKPSPLAPLKEIDPDLEVIIGVLQPVLAAAMGNMGENFHFFVLPNTSRNGAALVSPYEFGELQVSLADGTGGKVQTSIELPLDSLFVPRECPNGRYAHVTWNYCPWGGEKLDD